MIWIVADINCDQEILLLEASAIGSLIHRLIGNEVGLLSWDKGGKGSTVTILQPPSVELETKVLHDGGSVSALLSSHAKDGKASSIDLSLLVSSLLPHCVGAETIDIIVIANYLEKHSILDRWERKVPTVYRNINIHTLTFYRSTSMDIELAVKGLTAVGGGDGANYNVKLPHGQATHLTIMAVNSLIEVKFSPYRGVLVCGNLRSSVTFTPTYSNKGRQLPPQLVIMGFINIDDVSNIPYMSRHIIVPSNDGGTVVASSLEEAPSYPLLNMLLVTLDRTDTVAMVGLDKEGWRALVFPIVIKDGTSRLAISVLFPGFNMPSLGDVSSLCVGEEGVGTYMPRSASFDTGGEMDQMTSKLTSSIVEKYFKRLMIVGESLPDEKCRCQLFDIINKIRSISLNYNVDTISGKIYDYIQELIKKQRVKISGIRTRSVGHASRRAEAAVSCLKEIIDFLATVDRMTPIPLPPQTYFEDVY
jgi:hypothetical protein